MKNIAIILSGGTGARFGAKIPKQFLVLKNGKTCLEQSFLAFYNHQEIDEIIIVSLANYIEKTQEIIAKYQGNKKISVIRGGSYDRSSSVYQALSFIKEKEVNVIIHDGARPLVSHRIISDSVNKLKEFDAVNTAINITDSLLEAENGLVKKNNNRGNFMAVQTPQSFLLSKLKFAYDQEIATNKELLGWSDDCSLYLKYFPNDKIKIIAGEYSNIKLTKEIDMFFINYYLK